MYLRASPTSCSRRSVISKEKTNVFQSVLVSNATPLSFFLQKILLPKLWGQAVVLNLRLSSNPLRILPNVRGLPSNFATTYNSKAYALPSSRRQHSARRLPIKQDGLVYKFTFGWGWKPWQGRVHYDYELAEPGSRLTMIDTRLHLGLSGFRTRPAIHWLITTCVLGCILYYLVLECTVLLAHLWQEISLLSELGTHILHFKEGWIIFCW